MRKISILGSTGSIGTQTLDVVRHNPDKFKVCGLSTNKNIELLYEQIQEFKPSAVAVNDMYSAERLKEMLKDQKTEIVYGSEGLVDIAVMDEADMILTSVVGMVGLVPTLRAIEHNKIVALANKETLVAGGKIVKEALKKSKSSIIPVDSEHCAIFQCLQCSRKESEVQKIILTASGGPFRGKKPEEIADVTPEKALKHPRWNMGRKISIDSATLMNKGLEVIEAHWLFDADFDKIDVVIHPQSIIHSMVEFVDGAIIAQLGVADMRNPILYALSYPDRAMTYVDGLKLTELSSLTFEKPDIDTFRSLKLAYDAGSEGGTMPAVLNAANEAAVDLYLNGKIKFLSIPDIVENAMLNHINVQNPGLDDILEADRATREMIYKKLKVVV
jgi:1-deoxy-D-xylulose 5-phosphate reductoisomerase